MTAKIVFHISRDPVDLTGTLSGDSDWNRRQLRATKGQLWQRLRWAQWDAKGEPELVLGAAKEPPTVQGLVDAINQRLDKFVRPYADERLPYWTERASIRDLYGDDIIDDLEAILKDYEERSHVPTCASQINVKETSNNG